MSPILGSTIPRTFGASNMSRPRRYRGETMKYKLPGPVNNYDHQITRSRDIYLMIG